MEGLGVLELRGGAVTDNRRCGWRGWVVVAAVLLSVFCVGFSCGARWERERADEMRRMYPDPVCDRCGRLECSEETCGPEWEIKGE